MGLLETVRKIFNKSEKNTYPIEEVRQLENGYRTWLQNNPRPLPSQEQIDWLNAEVGMFAHFGINTFNNKEWSDGTLPSQSFNPTDLDCAQWVQVAKDLGAKYIIATAKHHDGFCLWQTKTTDYSVASSPWKDGQGDVVEEFVDACRAADMRFGFYLSPWDRHEEKFGCYTDEEAYDNFYCTQLTELLSDYANHDEVFEIWFDGAGSAGHTYNWQKIMEVCNKYQPSALIFNMGSPNIRWVGNEDGLAGVANWNVMKVGNTPGEMAVAQVKNVGVKIKECYGLGNYWMPAECDTSIRKTRWGAKHWFYHTNDEKSVLSLERLVEIYHKSVGRGANLLLNLPPNRQGKIPELDAKRAKELGDFIRQNYSNPIATTHGEGNTITLTIDEVTEIQAIIIQEEIAKGERIREYNVYIRSNGEWKEIFAGYNIGHKRIIRIPRQPVSQIKVEISNSFGTPYIKNLAAYR